MSQNTPASTESTASPAPAPAVAPISTSSNAGASDSSSTHHKNLDNLNISLPFEASTLMMIAAAGLILKVFFANSVTKDGSTGPASAIVWGYGVTALALIGLFLVVTNLNFNPSLSKSAKTNGEEKIDIMTNLKTVGLSFIKNSFPIVSLLVVLGWIIMINMKFMDRINKGKVAPEFEQFSLYSTILIFFQILLVFKFIMNKMKPAKPSTNTGKDEDYIAKMDKALNTQLTSVSAVLALLNLIFAGMMQVVAEFFSTDG